MTSLWRHSRLTYYDLGHNFLTQGVELLPGEVWQNSKRNCQYFRSYWRKTTGEGLWPPPPSGARVNNFRTTGSIHLKHSQNPKWLWVNYSQLLRPRVTSGQWPTTIVIPAFVGVSGYRPLAGRGAKSPQPITPEPMVAAIRARRRSKALKETLPMNALKQFSEVVLKFKVRSNVKNRRFQFFFVT